MTTPTDHWVIPSDVSRIEQKVDLLLRYVRFIINEEIIVSQELDDLTTQVAANKDVTQSAITLIQGIKARLDAAGTDPTKLKALRDDLAAQDLALANAVAANTPAAPPV
jgi:hypothetical protein